MGTDETQVIDIIRLLIEAFGGWAGLILGLLGAAAVYNFNRDQLRDRRHLALCYILIRKGVLTLDEVLDGKAIDDPRRPEPVEGIGIKL
jgi:hypothetical protein